MAPASSGPSSLVLLGISVLGACWLGLTVLGAFHIHSPSLPHLTAGPAAGEAGAGGATAETLLRRVNLLEEQARATEREILLAQEALRRGKFHPSVASPSPETLQTRGGQARPGGAVGAAAVDEGQVYGRSSAAGLPSAVPRARGSRCGPDGIVAVTYASHGGKDDRFCRAVESAILNGVPWEVLGWGEEWLGLSQKLQASLDYAKSLDEDCILLFSDAFDVLFTSDLKEIKQKFLTMQKPLVFAGECGCWPQVVKDKDRGLPEGTICNTLYPPSPTPYRFLNSGAWIGYARQAEHLLEAVVAKANSEFGMKTNDQEMVSDMYIDGQFDIALDHQAEVFQCMHDTGSPPLPLCNPGKHLTLIDGVWHNKLTNTTPSLFHFNGGGKKHHLDMEAKSKHKLTPLSPEDKRRIYNTELLFNNKLVNFESVCSRHLEKSDRRR
eukprot:CAMPEP_0118986668 /NCGR_PEP_ID=MMETSP1173-20130426/42590_1 /TAXON_ID=1034831 /ORGANISM="Rhizochromulina marina cf, Strain CCMP1243" /LENGTH=438 /DNA_ID=CAMNT_0006937465 /DNA_START=101 /DNA_END=1414 /DNA_ORIENTATION=-